MARVVATFKIFPSDPEAALDGLREAVKGALPKEIYVHKFSEEPIAFGLKALIADVVMGEDEEGGMERLEELIKKVDGVSQLEILMVRRA